MSARAHRIAILGATGMLGQALSIEARRQGHEVTGIARSNADVSADAADSMRLLECLAAIEPSVIINAAAITSLDACEKLPGAAYEINARVAAVLARFCVPRTCKLVQISTDHYFTGDRAELHDEMAPVTLLNEYARTKYAAEAFAATCPDYMVARTNLVGFRGWAGRPTFTEWALDRLSAAQPMTLFDDFYTSSLDVSAFATQLLKLLTLDARGLLNVAAHDVASKKDFVLGLASRLKLPTDLCQVGSVRNLEGAARAESLGLDVSKAEGMLGYALPDTEAVLDALARQYEEQKR